MQKRLAAPSRASARVRARGLRSDGYWEEVEVGKRWRLVRGGGWQEVELDLLVRLSNLVSYTPNLYFIKKLNSNKNSAHLVCRLLSYLVDINYSRLL